MRNEGKRLALPAREVALIGVFASLHIILYLIPMPLWRNWAILIEPIMGVILGPWVGYLAALIGSTMARVIKPTELWMFGVFAEPLGALAAGFLAKGNWKPILAIYVVMLSAYFIHPLGRQLPLWPILDVLLSLALIYPTAKISKRLSEDGIKHLTMPLILIALVSIAMDALARIFLFIPAGLYSFFGLTNGAVYIIFVTDAINSFIEDALVVITAFIIGPPILTAIRRASWLRIPLS
ncbi:MAG: hypothetical protein QXS79_02325 [Candidatus Bathyarchaeia archaeon]